MAQRPDLEGQQFSSISGSRYVYIVIDGILRWIPSTDVWSSLFTIWNVATVDISGIDGFSDDNAIPPPFPLPGDCRVVRGDLTPKVFLVDFRDPRNHALPPGSTLVKRWIQSPAAMDAYRFRWPYGVQSTTVRGDPSPLDVEGAYALWLEHTAITTVVPQVVIDVVPDGTPLPLGSGVSGYPF